MILTRYFEGLQEQYRPEEGFYTCEVNSPDRLPVLTYLPTGYEPNYAYPLVIFLHGRGRCERQIMRLAPRVSRRNHICIGLRGPEPYLERRTRRPAYSWGSDSQAEAYAEEYVFRAIERIEEYYRIHPQRIFLAGVCEGALHAYRLGLAFPNRFAGVIALNGHMPPNGKLFRYPEVRRLRVLIGHGIANSVVPLSSAKRDYRLLYSAGVQVDLNTYMTTHRLDKQMLRDSNRWIMQIVNSGE